MRRVRTVVSVSALFELIEAYRRDYGPTQNAVARLSDIDPRTLSSWKTRGTLPDPVDLARLAQTLHKPYRVVLDAALTDAGWLPEPDLDALPSTAVARRRGRRSPRVT